MTKKIDRFTGEYRFLSNFYPCTIRHLGDTYPSVEHAYQASKVMGEGDDWHEDIRIKIRDSKTPAETKKIGNFCPLRKNWDNIKLEIMRNLVFTKFSTHEDLKRKLLLTEDAELIEGNDWGDIFFGVCRGYGKNWLGVILMNTRDILKNPSYLNSFNGQEVKRF